MRLNNLMRIFTLMAVAQFVAINVHALEPLSDKLESKPAMGLTITIKDKASFSEKDIEEGFIPLYQSYREKDAHFSKHQIREMFDSFKENPRYHLLLAYNPDTEGYLGFMNFGHAPDMYLYPNYVYRTILDSVFVKDPSIEEEVYKKLFDEGVSICKQEKSHRLIAKTGGAEVEQENRLFSSNMEKFTNERRPHEAYYEYRLFS